MNTKDLIRLGVPVGEPIALAHEFIQNFIAQGNDGAQLEAEIFNIVANPPTFFAGELRAPLDSELLFVARYRRCVRDTGENGVHSFPIHAGGALGDGGALRGMVELRRERAGHEGVHRDVLAGGEFARLRGEAIGKCDLNRHGVVILVANSRGGKTSMPRARAGFRWRILCVTIRRAAES